MKQTMMRVAGLLLLLSVCLLLSGCFIMGGDHFLWF